MLGLSASAARGGCDVGGGEGGATRGGCDGPVSSCPLAVETWGLVEATGKAGLLAVGRSGDWCASVGSRDGSKSADGLGGLGAGGGGSMVYEALATLDCNSCPFQMSLCRLEGLGFGSIGCNSCAPFTLASANEEGVRSVAFLRLLGFRIANEACEELTPATHRNGVDHSGFPDLNAAAPVEHSWSGLRTIDGVEYRRCARSRIPLERRVWLSVIPQTLGPTHTKTQDTLSASDPGQPLSGEPGGGFCPRVCHCPFQRLARSFQAFSAINSSIFCTAVGESHEMEIVLMGNCLE